MREFELIDLLTSRLAPRRDDTERGIGDDAAVLKPTPGRRLAVTTDTLIAGRHFPHDTDPADIGYKAIAVNLSDLAAMGADPAWLTVSLAAPTLARSWCEALIEGMQAACCDGSTALPIDIVGGDTTRADTLTLGVTAIGQVDAGGAITRGGARVGDWIAVTGTLGDAAAGLRLWPARHAAGIHEQALIDRLTRPTLRNGAALAGRVHAALDVSDGLLADVEHIARASRLGAQIALNALPCSEHLAAVVPDVDDRQRLQATGGDDYELCMTFAPGQYDALARALDCPLCVIGEIVASQGVTLIDAQGQAQAAADYGIRGWDHFAQTVSSGDDCSHGRER